MARKVRLVKAGSPYYWTSQGQAFLGNSLDLMKQIPDKSINLVLTSPPFALQRKKKYGNVSPEEYLDWFLPFAEEIHRILTPTGSLVLEVGGAWKKGEPIRSLYNYELLLALCNRTPRFKLAQEFYWYNPAKLPAPAEWVTIRRMRVKDAVTTIWWLSKSAFPQASNRRILTPYRESMMKLLRNGYNAGPRPSEHKISKKWGVKNGGAIPPNLLMPSNLLTASNTKSIEPYINACRSLGLRVHPARFVDSVPTFFVNFLTRPGQFVLDPFAGSNVVGSVAESLGRRWLSSEQSEEYLIGSAFRFPSIHTHSELLKRRQWEYGSRPG
jgi:DNA modification methylase